MRNKWQTLIEDLLTVFKSSKELTDAINKQLGENAKVKESSICRIRKGVQTKIYHDIGQAIMILHVRYVIKGKL